MFNRFWNRIKSRSELSRIRGTNSRRRARRLRFKQLEERQMMTGMVGFSALLGADAVNHLDFEEHVAAQWSEVSTPNAANAWQVSLPPTES